MAVYIFCSKKIFPPQKKTPTKKININLILKLLKKFLSGLTSHEGSYFLLLLPDEYYYFLLVEINSLASSEKETKLLNIFLINHFRGIRNIKLIP